MIMFQFWKEQSINHQSERKERKEKEKKRKGNEATERKKKKTLISSKDAERNRL